MEYGDLESLANALSECLNKKILKNEISNKAIQTYSFEKMAEEYYEVYSGLV